MALITFPTTTRRSSATRSLRLRPLTLTGVTAFLTHLGRRLADAPLDSLVLLTRPVAGTQARTFARAQARADARWGTGASHAMEQHWTPVAGPDGEVRLVASWQPRH
ncbi:hypothetical protein [Streptacidiphilus sp. EB129]|uniref:hypothetical protein n=1 Tax=Streptacidiphilus sp. EB129 TaxID=3156262 RepID=UPI00351369EF